MRCRGVVFAVGMLLGAQAFAQVPGKIGYQGRLMKTDGTPETGNQSLTFKIWDVESGGANPICSETQSVALTDGYYAVTLGGNGCTLDATTFNGSERFLEVSVGSDALSPRQKIDSVPYALMCTNLNGGTVSATTVNATSVTSTNLTVSGGMTVGSSQVIDNTGKWVGASPVSFSGTGSGTAAAYANHSHSTAAPISGDGTSGNPITMGKAALYPEHLVRQGLFTDVARGRPVSVNTGGTIGDNGPTSEMGTSGYWSTNTFPSSFEVDLGGEYYGVFQISFESFWRGDTGKIPAFSGAGAYQLSYSRDHTNWISVPAVAPVEGDVFIHRITPGTTNGTVRYVKLSIIAPNTAGAGVNVSTLRVLSAIYGDSSAIDARRLYAMPGVPAHGVVAAGICVNGLGGIFESANSTSGGATCSNFTWTMGSGTAATLTCPTGTTKWLTYHIRNSNNGGEGGICVR